MNSATRPAWRVAVHDQAVSSIKALSCAQIGQVEETMKLLAQEEDPRKPNNRRLNVVPLEATDKYWFRVRSLDNKLRILFRILRKRGEIIYVVDAYAERPSATGALQILKACPRNGATYKGLRELFRKVEKK